MSRFENPVVLLIQPDSDNREMYAEFLRHQGLAVLAFADGGEALKVAPLASVIVTEMRGTIDGAQLIASVHADERTRKTPVIVLSASALTPDRERMEAAGCDCFLPMPCFPDELLGQVQVLLARTGKVDQDTVADARVILRQPSTIRRRHTESARG